MLCYSICNGLDNCNILVMEESKCHFFTSTPAMVKDPNGKSRVMQKMTENPAPADKLEVSPPRIDQKGNRK